MLLYRTTKGKKPKHQEYRNRKDFQPDPSAGRVTVPFGFFGEDQEGQRERWQHFEVVVDWSDVEGLILQFQKMREARALQITKALRIAAVLKPFLKKDR